MAMVDGIEGFFNRRHRHSSPGNNSPSEFEAPQRYLNRILALRPRAQDHWDSPPQQTTVTRSVKLRETPFAKTKRVQIVRVVHTIDYELAFDGQPASACDDRLTTSLVVGGKSGSSGKLDAKVRE